ncbi:hypothetical protein B0H16DRAFT_1780159 [Mycena metata]|uniref:Uncharacterized protein n=1 Tax=Mycena metata TaxID=1033252 RepID=A0AAD7HRU2_9AGAR|nr:hypothetical protein B0H16DRAFT_1780159 [Mycena metata]
MWCSRRHPYNAVLANAARKRCHPRSPTTPRTAVLSDPSTTVTPARTFARAPRARTQPPPNAPNANPATTPHAHAPRRRVRTPPPCPRLHAQPPPRPCTSHARTGGTLHRAYPPCTPTTERLSPPCLGTRQRRLIYLDPPPTQLHPRPPLDLARTHTAVAAYAHHPHVRVCTPPPRSRLHVRVCTPPLRPRLHPPAAPRPCTHAHRRRRVRTSPPRPRLHATPAFAFASHARVRVRTPPPRPRLHATPASAYAHPIAAYARYPRVRVCTPSRHLDLARTHAAPRVHAKQTSPPSRAPVCMHPTLLHALPTTSTPPTSREPRTRMRAAAAAASHARRCCRLASHAAAAAASRARTPRRTPTLSQRAPAPPSPRTHARRAAHSPCLNAHPRRLLLARTLLPPRLARGCRCRLARTHAAPHTHLVSTRTRADSSSSTSSRTHSPVRSGTPTSPKSSTLDRAVSVLAARSWCARACDLRRVHLRASLFTTAALSRYTQTRAPAANVATSPLRPHFGAERAGETYETSRYRVQIRAHLGAISVSAACRRKLVDAGKERGRWEEGESTADAGGTFSIFEFGANARPAAEAMGGMGWRGTCAAMPLVHRIARRDRRKVVGVTDLILSQPGKLSAGSCSTQLRSSCLQREFFELCRKALGEAGEHAASAELCPAIDLNAVGYVRIARRALDLVQVQHADCPVVHPHRLGAAPRKLAQS